MPGVTTAPRGPRIPDRNELALAVLFVVLSFVLTFRALWLQAR